MSINKTWTLLSRGTQDSMYGRQIPPTIFTPNPVSEAIHDILVPQSDTAFMSLCTEQLVQTMMESTVRDSLLELDPVNTYSYPILSMASNTFSTMAVPPELNVYVLNENAGRSYWTLKTFSIKVSPVDSKVTVSTPGSAPVVSTYSLTNGLSNKILLADMLYLRFSGVIPAVPFTFSVQYFNRFNRTLGNILEDLGDLQIPWSDESLRELLDTTRNPVEKVAALSLSTYRMLANVNN